MLIEIPDLATDEVEAVNQAKTRLDLSGDTVNDVLSNFIQTILIPRFKRQSVNTEKREVIRKIREQYETLVSEKRQELQDSVDTILMVR